MTKAIIGGKAIEVDFPNFLFLEAAWIPLSEARGAANPMAGVAAVLGVVAIGENAAGKQEPPNQEAVDARVAELKRAMKPAEMIGLRTFIEELMVDIGLAPKPGETEPVRETPLESPSPAISEA